MTRARILADYVSGGTTAAEFDYMDGVTSNVQTQLTAKAPLASPAFTGTPTGITAAHITSGVLPVGVTGGSGLTHLASNPTVTLGSNATFPAGHVIGFVHDSSTGCNTVTSRIVIYAKSITLKSASSVVLIQMQVQLNLNSALMGVFLYRKESVGVDTGDTLIGNLNPYDGSSYLSLYTTYNSYETFHTTWKDTTSHSVDDEVFYGVAFEKTSGTTLAVPAESATTDGTISLTLWEILPNA